MEIRERGAAGSDKQTGDGGGVIPLPIPPPPPIRLVSILFALAAAVAGFLGFSRTAAAFASISLGTNVLDYATNRASLAESSATGTGDAVETTAGP